MKGGSPMPVSLMCVLVCLPAELVVAQAQLQCIRSPSIAELVP